MVKIRGMEMNQNIAEQERRRQIQEQKRKRRRRRMLQRNIILLGGLLLVIFIVKGTIHVLAGGSKEEATASNSQSVKADLNQKNQGNNQAQDKDRLIRGEEGLMIEKKQEDLREGHLVLVNDQNPITQYSDEHLVEIGSYLEGICNMKSKEIKLKEEAAVALKEMLITFNDEVGENDLTVISGYRDFNTQEALHYESIQEEQQASDTFVARPDRSEHHTGLAVDFGLCYKDGTSSHYDGTGIYEWINNNCYKYGFILRYDTSKKELTGIGYEPWHFRYVGKVHAQIIKELNLCLEEYIEQLKSYTYYSNPGQGITKDTQNYSIYYVPAEGSITNIPVPTNKKYDISGNNMDGYIVTAYLA